MSTKKENYRVEKQEKFQKSGSAQGKHGAPEGQKGGKMNIKPLSDRLIVKRLMPAQPTTSSGILLPPVEESQNTPYKGEIIAIGPGKYCELQPAGTNLVDALDELIAACYTAMVGGSKAMIGSAEGVLRQNVLRHLERAQDAKAEHQKSGMRIPMTVKVGDHVLYSKHGNQEFRIDGETLITLGQDSVIGIVD